MSTRVDIIENRIDYISTFNYTSDLKASDFVTKISENEYLFEFNFIAPKDIDFSLTANLPEKATIAERNGALAMSRPVQISTDGRRISLEWSASIAQGEQITYFVRYNTSNEQVQNDYFMPVAFLAFLALGFLAGYKLKKFRKESLMKQAASEDEKEVLDIIIKKKEVLQEDLRESTNWSKTKISKVVRSLESKGMIKKAPYRKTNKLKIR
ncbi:MAG: hypothetical protein V1850_06870 [Candidatus Bathyarchaeota archaeon]